jgi:uncharacterized protein YabE (DUF348 family)
MRSVGVENMTWNQRSKIKVLHECNKGKFTKTTQVYTEKGKPIGKEVIWKEK